MVYGSERKKIEGFEIMCLRNIWGIRRVYRIRNLLTREKRGYQFSVLDRIKRNMLKWFRNVERMAEERLAKRVYRANVESNKGRVRPQRR